MQYETIADDRMPEKRRMIEQWSVRNRTSLFMFACQHSRLARILQYRTSFGDDKATRQL